MILLVLVVALVAGRDAGHVPRRLRSIAPPAILAGLAFLPIAAAYERMDGISDYRREVPYSMDLSHFVATQPREPALREDRSPRPDPTAKRALRGLRSPPLRLGCGRERGPKKK